MVGREVHFARETTSRNAGKVRLKVERLSAKPFVTNASFEVRTGEIVCLAGLVGSGRSETCEALFGARPRDGGAVQVDGKAVNFKGPWDAMAAGIGMVPEDRKDAGLFLSMDIARNISATVLSKVSSAGLVSESSAEALANRFIQDLRIATPSAKRAVGDLSGGNQQKVLLAKWLATEPHILIVDAPTRGVDVGARAEIYRIMVVSSDLPEVLTLADRIVVMADGRTVGEMPGEGATEEAVLRLATQFTSLQTPAVQAGAHP
jgi:ABC-type sugar transport system ATPase subunit